MNSKKHLIILVLTMLLLVSLACSFPGFGGKEPAQTPDVPATDSKPEVQPQATQPEVVPTTQSQAQADLGQSLTVKAGGFTLSLPSDYQVASEPGSGILVAIARDGNQDDGPGFLAIGVPLTTTMSMDDVYVQMTNKLVPEEGMTLSEPYPVKVNGVEGMAQDISGKDGRGVAVGGKIVVLLPEADQAFLMMGFATEERWKGEIAKLMEDVLDSITFFEPEEVAMPTEEPLASAELRQWASFALASTEYGSTAWSAMRATGAPDVYPNCADDGNAWAPESWDTQDWIELAYDVPVVPAEINIYETYTPGQISEVQVFDVDGKSYTVYTADPAQMDCPNVLTISVSGVDKAVTTVRILIDQTVLQTDWAEIDAVELVGMSESGAMPQATSTTEAVSYDVPENYLWRIGGESGWENGQFYAVGGMDSDENGLIYLTSGLQGVYVIDTEGNLLDLYEVEGMHNPADLNISPKNGYIYVSAWGSSEVVVLTREGELVTRFGEEGTGNGQFSEFGPEALAVAPGGNVFVADEIEDENGNKRIRVQVFNPMGKFVRQFLLEDEFISVSDIDFGPNGDLYVLDFFGEIQQYKRDGTLVKVLPDDAIANTVPQSMFIDSEGNFYISTWTPGGARMLDGEGNLVRQFGFEYEGEDFANLPLGSFVKPQGIGATQDGSIVIVGDWPTGYGYLTAFANK